MKSVLVFLLFVWAMVALKLSTLHVPAHAKSDELKPATVYQLEQLFEQQRSTNTEIQRQIKALEDHVTELNSNKCGK